MELKQSWVAIRDSTDFSPILTLTGQYAHEWDEKLGISAQFERDEVFGKIDLRFFHARDQCTFLRALTASASETWQADRYSHSAVHPFGTLSPRSDDTNLVAFTISAPMWYDRLVGNAGVPDANRLEAIVEYRHTSRESNVASKTFDQNVVLCSLKLNF